MIAVMGGMSAAWVSCFLNHHPRQGLHSKHGLVGKLSIALKLSGIAPFRSQCTAPALAPCLFRCCSLPALAGIGSIAAECRPRQIALFASSAICSLFLLCTVHRKRRWLFPESLWEFSGLCFWSLPLLRFILPTVESCSRRSCIMCTCASLPLQWVPLENCQ